MFAKFNSDITGEKSHWESSATPEEVIRKVVSSPSLEVFKSWLDNLFDLMLVVALLQEDCWSTWCAEVSYNQNFCGSVFSNSTLNILPSYFNLYIDLLCMGVFSLSYERAQQIISTSCLST